MKKQRSAWREASEGQYAFSEALCKEMRAWRRKRLAAALLEILKVLAVCAFYIGGGIFIACILYGFFFTPY